MLHIVVGFSLSQPLRIRRSGPRFLSYEVDTSSEALKVLNIVIKRVEVHVSSAKPQAHLFPPCPTDFDIGRIVYSHLLSLLMWFKITA